MCAAGRTTSAGRMTLRRSSCDGPLGSPSQVTTPTGLPPSVFQVIGIVRRPPGIPVVPFAPSRGSPCLETPNLSCAGQLQEGWRRSGQSSRPERFRTRDAKQDTTQHRQDMARDAEQGRKRDMARDASRPGRRPSLSCSACGASRAATACGATRRRPGRPPTGASPRPCACWSGSTSSTASTTCSCTGCSRSPETASWSCGCPPSWPWPAPLPWSPSWVPGWPAGTRDWPAGRPSP